MTGDKKIKPLDNHIGFLTQIKDGLIHLDGISDKIEKPSLLLHSCCGPCSTAVVDRLAEQYRITLFFYNPCITDESEYKKRRMTQKSFVDQYNESLPSKEHIRFTEGPYDTKNFYQAALGLEDEPEGGSRCRACFQQRLERTAETAKLLGHDYFGTTLTVSPHKNYDLISSIGRQLALRYSLSFIDEDFKKKNGYQCSIVLSKKYGLYRQNYCGCEYSK